MDMDLWTNRSLKTKCLFKDIKMFKKTLVAAALTTAAMGANAWQVAQNETSSLEVYGVTAISIATTAKGNEGDLDKDGNKVSE